ncbi:phage tail tube protein [Roseburia sp. 1XD42-69]|uniref:phage tail tube protein n=1 Tax=Roseburia sp. 1XD42-69 TaxID=2320088 RepID=UPI000EA3FAB7|nr:phage tail tube protein [Roseburia sp. 1XD42-69]RKJ64843.1 hypothetical protein D7Y06_11115 [Roseburia sp. 1XD42-69]
MRNQRSSADARYARSGKDAAVFNKDGVLLASADSFTATSSSTNAKYNPLGNVIDLETNVSIGIKITMSQIVVESDLFFREYMEGLATGNLPVWDFQGSLLGRNGSEERVVYRDCIPSGDITIQDFQTGDVIKRNWSLHCNSVPTLQSRLTI